MSRNGLDRFFEQMLAEPQSVEDPAIMAARRALGAALTSVPDEIYEAEAAQCFLDRVAAETSPAPPELVAAVTAEFTHQMREATVTVSRKRVVPRWGWAAGAVAASVLAILASTRLSQKYAAPQPSIVEASTVAALQAPAKSDIANLVPLPPPPASTMPQRSDSLIDGKAFNNVAQPAPAPEKPKRGPEPVYTAPNPPLALTSHRVTAEDYPIDSVRLLEQGTVRLKYTIDTDGTVSNCTITISSGFARLDEAACILVQKWIFKPATVIGGAPVAVTLPAEIVFVLAPGPSAPPPIPPGRSGGLIGGSNAKVGETSVPTPPVALTSHVVTADDYPADSIRLAEQGRVQIKYTIGTDGRVVICGVTMSSRVPRLDAAACDMVAARWKFKPATQNGRPVAVSIPAEIIFALK